MAARSRQPVRTPRFRRPVARLGLEELELRLAPTAAPILVEVEPNETLTRAQFIPVRAEVRGAIATAADVDWYRVRVAEPALLHLYVGPGPGSSLDPRLTLFDPDGRELVTSDDFAPGHTPSAIDQHVLSGDYFLQITAAGAQPGHEIGTYDLQANSQPASGTGLSFETGKPMNSPVPPLSSDVNGDGHLDVLTLVHNYTTGRDEVSVLLGNGDGTFQPQRGFAAGYLPRALEVADVNRDGRPDVVVNGYLGLSVLLNTGTDTLFQQQGPVIAVGNNALAVADVNRDGWIDVIVADYWNVSVLLNRKKEILVNSADSVFEQPRRFTGSVPESYQTLLVADVNGDEWLDVITADYWNATLLLNSRDATLFQGVRRFPVRTSASHPLLATDVNGDNRLDLVTADYFTVSVLVNTGDDSGDTTLFQAAQSFAVGYDPISLRAADIDWDGDRDVVAANRNSDDVSVLLNTGSDPLIAPTSPLFQEQRRFVMGNEPGWLLLDDFNGDGRPDLATANRYDDVTVRLNSGDERLFEDERRFVIGRESHALLLADVNEDRRPDLVASYWYEGKVSVLVGNGDGTFRDQRLVLPGIGYHDLAVVDVNGDGHPDVLTPHETGGSVSVLLGNGDGTFRDDRRFGVGKAYWLTVADLNRDGRLDVVVGEDYYVSILLGNGDGTFQEERRNRARSGLLSVADLNRDGSLDVVTANMDDATVSVLLGNGDGTFGEQHHFAAGDYPGAMVVADIDRDGWLDLATANAGSGTVSVLLNSREDTLFAKQQRFPVGASPRSLVAADLDRDGWLDLATGNAGSGTVSVLLNSRAADLFRKERSFAVGAYPGSLLAADLDGDGWLDLATANTSGGTVSVLRSSRDTSLFTDQHVFPAEDQYVLEAADLDGDGRLDLVSGIHGDNVSVLLNTGSEPLFQGRTRYPVNYSFTFRLVDVNADGQIDVVHSGGSLLLGQGDGTLFASLPERAVDARHTPWRGDLNGDRIPDTVVLTAAGDILFRRGLRQGANLFAPPVVVNPGQPAREITLVQTVAGPAVAAADLGDDTVSVYRSSRTGFLRSESFYTGQVPHRLRSADLNGDGWADLVVTSTLGHSVTVAFQDRAGSLTITETIPVGVTPSDLAFTDLNEDGWTDILVSDRSGGDVTVLYNDRHHRFAVTSRYRAGQGPFGLQQIVPGQWQPQGRGEPVSLVSGQFNGDRLADVIVLDQAQHRFFTLLGTPGSGFSNPQLALSGSTSAGLKINDRPGAMVARDFTGDGVLDLAILMEDRGEVWLYRGQGDGTFVLQTTVSASLEPTGLNVDDLNRDGKLDLLVGNGYGDILFILGNGDGTFRPFVRADKHVPLVVTDVNGDGRPEVLLANQATDQALLLSRRGGGFTPAGFVRRGKELIGPGDVAVADLDGRYGPDLILANTGSNNVLVYLRQANGSFAATPRSYFAGTSPTALRVAQLTDDNGDGAVDGSDLTDLVVANAGSDDVSVLLGAADAAGWTFRPGPRLSTGGAGPNGVVVQDQDGDGVPDLLVANAQSRTLATLLGIGANRVGNGFFNDVTPAVVPLPDVPRQILPGPRGEVLVVTRGGAILDVNPAAGGVRVVFDPPGGRGVNAVAVAGDFLFAARQGEVAVLAREDGRLVEQARLPDLGLQAPDALQVLQLGGGRYEVYVADAGESQPVLLTFDLQPEPAAVGAAPLALALALVTVLPVEATRAEAAVAEAVAAIDVATPQVVVPVVRGAFLVAFGEGVLAEALAEVATDATGEEPPAAGPGGISLWGFISGTEELLQRLGLVNPPPADDAPPDPAESDPTGQQSPVSDWSALTGPLPDLVLRVVSDVSASAAQVMGGVFEVARTSWPGNGGGPPPPTAGDESSRQEGAGDPTSTIPILKDVYSCTAEGRIGDALVVGTLLAASALTSPPGRPRGRRLPPRHGAAAGRPDEERGVG